MKKIISFVSFIILLTPAMLSAGDITLGVTGWYSVWDFHVKEKMQGNPNPFNTLERGESFNKSFNMDSALMTGPMLSFNISEKWNFSAIGLMSATTYNMKSGYNLPVTSPVVTTLDVDVAIKFTRYDVDATLNYKLTDSYKLIFGMKYLGFRGDGYYNFSSPSVLNDNTKFTLNQHTLGPAFGLSYTGRVSGNLFILANGTALFGPTWSKEIKDSTNGADSVDNFSRTWIGCNSSLAFAYYISDAAITLSAGGRYQALINTEDSDQISQFYGIFCAVNYTFSFGGTGD